MVEPEIRYRRPALSPGLILGALIMGAGVILLLDQFGVIRASEVFHFFWPLVLIVAGIARIVHCDTTPGRIWGAILVFGGVAWGMHDLGYNAELIWPILLIAVGALLFWRALERPDEMLFRRGPVSVSRLNQWAIFGGGEYRSSTQQFEGGEVLAIFGGCKIDLRGADIAAAAAYLNAIAMFGGVELLVPESWNVIPQGLPILGGFVDSTRHPRDVEHAKQFVVKGFAMFGGVEVKN